MAVDEKSLTTNNSGIESPVHSVTGDLARVLRNFTPSFGTNQWHLGGSAWGTIVVGSGQYRNNPFCCGIILAMRRELVWIEQQHFRGFGCSECGWRFKPLGTPAGASFDETMRNFELQRDKEFTAHVCAHHSKS
jgi:hypothetical protein